MMGVKKRIYCDYAATTPVAPEVMAAMRPYFGTKFGNAGSLHWFGQEASAAVFRARQTIAGALGCSYKEIIFTGSATEANNLALRGVVRAAMKNEELRMKNENEKSKNFHARIIISSIEHGSVLETARDLERDGVEVVYIPVDREGIVDVEKIRAALNECTVLVSVQYANNEIGTIQPIQEIAHIVHGFDKNIIFHTDAVQAFQYLPCRIDELGVDLMTLSAHKIYGPKGAGLLYVRNSKHEARNTKQIQNLQFQNSNKYISDFGFRISDLQLVAPIVTGGHQEFGMRAGTENTPAIVGFGKAVEIVEKMRGKESVRMRGLRNYFWAKLHTIVPNAELNGSLTQRLPNNVNIYFPGHATSDLLIALDVAGVAASPGSACQAHVAEESYVVNALHGASDRASSSVRFTFGRGTTKADFDSVLRVIRAISRTSRIVICYH